MKKFRLLFFVFSLCVIEIFAQKEVAELTIDYKSAFYDNKESLAISNKKTGELLLFVEDTDKTKVVLLNKEFQILSQIETEALPSTFKTFIGHQINANGTYSIYFTNNSNKKYGILNLDLKQNKANINTLDFKLDKEAYVESVTFNDTFYLISVSRNETDVHFYTFNENGENTDKKSLSFDFLNGKGENGFYKKAFHFLAGSTGSLIKMDNYIPNAIETTSKPNKLYIIDDQFVFTFDNDNLKTIIAKINPSNFEITHSYFVQPNTETIRFSNYNSYLYDNKIFQIASASDEMRFSIKNLNSKELIKSIILKKEDTITFKNTPIIQEGPGLIAGTRIREMEETSKFLRKISRGNIGVSAYKQDENYKITLGSEIEVSRGGGFGAMPMGGFGAIPIASFGPISTSFNPTFFAYSGYSATKSTHIDCLFNSEFNHVEGEISENVFDRIKNFEDELRDSKSNNTDSASDSKGYKKISSTNYSKGIELTNVFNHNGKIYFSFLSKDDRNYHVIEFEQ